jgi:Ca2+-binding EF-hand superfamily protein
MEIGQILDAFRTLDKKNTGYLTAFDIRDTLKEFHFTDEDSKVILNHLDFNNNGRIQFS